ncbi:hypothetical protein [Flindersiella endophytica]
MLGYLKSFAPWIVFAILSTRGESRWGALAGFVLATVLLIVERRRGRGWDQVVIETSSALFFACLAVASFTISPAPLGDYGPAASLGWLALTAWGSLAISKPFTFGIARTMAPPEVWQSPVFYRLNAVLTAVWATGFTATSVALVALLHFAPHATVAVIAVKVLGFVLPAAFTVYYPNVVRARARRQAADASIDLGTAR